MQDDKDFIETDELIPERETTQSKWQLALQWVNKQPPSLLALRVYDQIARRLTGAPDPRYSRITPQLYIGGQHAPHGLGAMQAEGITSVVNLRREYDDAAAGVALERYLHLPVTDNTAPTQEHLHEGVRFITAEVARGGAVYVHCGVGVGRAPTLAAAYLVSTGLTPVEAWAQIKAVRPFIWPNRRQRRSIEQFAASQQASD